MKEMHLASNGGPWAKAAAGDHDSTTSDVATVSSQNDSISNVLGDVASVVDAGQQRFELLEDASRQVNRLRSDLAAATSDHRRNEVEMTNALIAAEMRLRSNTEEIQHLNAKLAALEADIAVARAFEASLSWQLADRARTIARRYPWAARQVRRLILLMWWTLQGEVVGKVRAAIAYRRSRMREPNALAPIGKDAIAPLLDDDQPPEVDDPWPPDRPLVSVVIPCFNYGHFITEAVDSVLAQTYRDFELIIVEGGSTALESRQLLLGLSRPGVRILLHGDAQRVGANRNLGIHHARGRYICCLDADDKLESTYVEKAVFLLERCGYDVVSSALRFFGNRKEVIHTIQYPDLPRMLEGNHVMTTAVFRRGYWEKAGGYQDSDPAVHGYIYEDWRLWVRFAALGARFVNLPTDPMLLYRSHGPSLSKGARPMDAQRQVIRALNADVLDPHSATQAAAEAAAARHRVPMSHLMRGIEPPNGPSLLLALPFMIIGGAERLLSALVGHLVKMGWRVVIVTTMTAGAEHGDTVNWFEAYTKEIFRLPGSLPEACWTEFLRYLLLSRRTDVLWIVGSEFVYRELPEITRLLPDIRVADLLFNTGVHADSNRQYRRWIDRTFVESEEVYRWLINDGAATDTVALVRSGVNTQRLRSPVHATNLRQSIGGTTGDLVIGYSGRWSEEKDPLAFVEIARRTDPTLPVRFVMTGAGHLGPDISRSVAAAKFPLGRFHVLGDVGDIQPWLHAYDLLVLPSRLDGRPVIVMEALAVGVPVLASRVGALPEMIHEGVTGWLFEAGDIDGFVARIGQVARDPDALIAMRRAARAFADAHLDERHMHELYDTRLRELVGAKASLVSIRPDLAKEARA
ncbi:MAG TPA: glycosyltransferase [Acetobacteraceae bacterium]|nr:glycosyltransferase [Acetobacteraceae bacterium]